MGGADPLSSREALRFEHVAGVPVVGAVRQLRAGELTAAAAVAALVVAGSRSADDVTVDDVLDSFPTHLELVTAAGEVLAVLTADPADGAESGG